MVDSRTVLDEAVEQLGTALADNPERDIVAAELVIQQGRFRRFPVLGINRQPDIDEPDEKPNLAANPDVDEFLHPTLQGLTQELRGMLVPLEMLNPIRAQFTLGLGPGTLAPSFGLELHPGADYTPSTSRSLDELLAEGMPDPETSGLLPKIREKIEMIKEYTPDWIKINPPDTQGPFNIAHLILGNEVFMLPLDRPDDFIKLMEMITEFFLAAHKTCLSWIGEARLPPFRAWQRRMRECSVNLVSREFYRKHILHHDRKVAKTWGQIAVHPCSGPHVFYETIRGIENVFCTEAGRIPCAVAGSIPVDEALKEIADKPITLLVQAELPQGREEEFVRSDIDRAVTNPRLWFNYFGMHWKKKDDHSIREMHKRLDEYWRVVAKQ